MPPAFDRALVAEVEALARRFAASDNQAFLIWFLTTILDLTEDEAFEATSLEGANDKGIDGFYVDNDQGRVIVAQAKYSPTMDVNVRESHLSKLQSSLHWLSSPEALRRDGRHDLAQAADDYLTALREGYGVELWFVYTAPRNKNIEKNVDVFNRNPDNIESSRSIRHFAYEAMEAGWHEHQDQQLRRINDECIKIGDGKHFSSSGAFGNAIVVSMPGSELVRLYEKYGDILFDRNVRLFLGDRKGSVNAGIASTLRDEQRRDKFWAFNNGITMLCDGFEIEDEDDWLLVVRNFNIINGCQITVSLARSTVDLTDVYALARIISPPETIVDDIIKFNNSQNPIKMGHSFTA